jgi:hypothetical protein
LLSLAACSGEVLVCPVVDAGPEVDADVGTCCVWAEPPEIRDCTLTHDECAHRGWDWEGADR